MFNTVLEVGKFEGKLFKSKRRTKRNLINLIQIVLPFAGAKIRTVSGIRGQIKKAVGKPEGVFRATFEDKIKLSDIVFCRTWYSVDVPKFYNPMTTLLLPPERKTNWEGMKTLGQLKRERNIKNEIQNDCLYTVSFFFFK